MTFRDDFNRMLNEGYERMERDLPPLGDGPQPTITVTKSTGYLLLSVDQLYDAGILNEEHARAQGWRPYVPPPVPWSRRLRWRWQAWRERAGRKIGGWLAGVDLSARDDAW